MTSPTTPISVQLYSLREESAADFEGVLRRLGDIGYVGVELAGWNGLAPSDVARICGEAGLVVSSAHVGATQADDLHAELDRLDAVGCTTAVLPFLPPGEFGDEDGVARCADVINANAAVARARGFTYGYHNHFWEFAAMPDGRTAWAHLLDRLDPAVVIELDAYWTKVGGADPVVEATALGSRLHLVHVKDGPADGHAAPMTAVGSGTMDIPGLVAAASAAAWHVVELDRCATDMFQAIEDSYAYLVGNGLSRGRT